MRGSVSVESALTMPLFLLLTFGLAQAGLLLWTQIGLQHGVEMAARCASINDAAINTNVSASLCFPGTAPASVTKSIIQSYAANNSWGVKPAASIFVVKTAAADNQQCSTGIYGDQVSVNNYQVDLINYIFSVSLNAQSCFPTTH
jgi:Flp pilus assembly protein TadG